MSGGEPAEVAGTLTTVPLRHRLGLAGYLLAYCLTVALAFLVPEWAPLFGVFLLLVVLYVLPMILVADSISIPVAQSLLVATTFLAMLIVVDPIEPGLFGSDAYNILADARRFSEYRGSISAFIIESEERPLFFVLVETLRLLTAASLPAIGKYLPLVTLTLPLLFYYALAQFSTARTALLSAFGLASVRTFLLVETQFINETLAVVILFAMLAVAATVRRVAPAILLLILFSVSLALTHHLTAAIGTLLFGVWGVTVHLSRLFHRTPSVLRRLLPVPGGHSQLVRSIEAGTVVTGGGFLGTYLFVEPETLQTLLSSAVGVLVFESAPTTSSGSVASGVGGAGSAVRTLLSSSGAMALLVGFALIGAWTILSRHENESWETAWVVVAGILSVAYVTFLVMGRLVWLDPTRFLIFLIPLLLAVVVKVVRGDATGGTRTAIAVALVALLALTQLAAIPSYVLHSNPDQTALAQNHQPESAFRAGDWLAGHGRGQTVGWQGVLWQHGRNDNYVSYEDFDGDCDDGTYLVWRDAARYSLGVQPETVDGDHSAVYDNGKVRLTRCVWQSGLDLRAVR